MCNSKFSLEKLQLSYFVLNVLQEICPISTPTKQSQKSQLNQNCWKHLFRTNSKPVGPLISFLGAHYKKIGIWKNRPKLVVNAEEICYLEISFGLIILAAWTQWNLLLFWNANTIYDIRVSNFNFKAKKFKSWQCMGCWC